MSTKTLRPRESDVIFQQKLTALCKEHGIPHHVFVGEFAASDKQEADRAVTSFSGNIEKTLRLVDALNDIVPEIIVNNLIGEIGKAAKIACADCPDKDTCDSFAKDVSEKGRQCNA